MTLDKDNGIVDAPDTSGRRWVKPVEALCAGLFDRIDELAKKVEDLENRSDGAAPVNS